MAATSFLIEERGEVSIVQLKSDDGINRLTIECVISLTHAIEKLARSERPLIFAGNDKFSSAGADLAEIFALHAPIAYEFSKLGQELMNSIDQFPAPIYAAVSGYCMGGGLDLALACRHRIASRAATFGHRGAALGLITGWGGTQRLPRMIGKGRALAMFVAAEKLTAAQAFETGLVDAIADDPVAEAMSRIGQRFARMNYS